MSRRGYNYNRAHKSQRERHVEKWIYRGKLALMLVVGGGIAVYLVILAINK